jgi:phosphatidylglycerol lysyltransferase
VADVLSSMIGVVLLLISRGLVRRLAAAYRAARVLLPLGIVTALLGGLVWESAVTLLTVFVLLHINRRAFYRREPLWREPVPAPWSAAVLTVLAGSIWIGFFAYAHVDQPGSLWSEFAWNGEAPRFLRATLAAGCTALLLGLLRLRWRESTPPMRTTLTEGEIARLVALDGRAEANRAFAAGGRFLLAEFGDACILYRRSGRSSVALGDPIGVPARDPELVWAFRELAERHDGLPVFFEASTPRLPLYLELGLSPLKISEAARIDLAAFSPDLAAELGAAPARAHIETSIVPAEAVPALLPHLEAVHDAWAAAERADRSRVVPDFDAAYVTRFDTVIAEHEDRIVAFGSLLVGTEDMALNPVHIRPDAKRSALRALLLRSIARAQERNCRWFDLGTAPLPAEPADSRWPSLSPASVRAFRYGDYFTQAEDLRRFKERFRPAWDARYLVCPGGIVLPQILREVALLAEGRRDRPRRSVRLPRFGLMSRQ